MNQMLEKNCPGVWIFTIWRLISIGEPKCWSAVIGFGPIITPQVYVDHEAGF